MKQRIRVFDTNTYSSYKNKITPLDVKNSALSSVVFYELTATKITSKKRRLWDSFFRYHAENKTLLVPTQEDWQICSRIIWQMHQNGESVPKSATIFQNDALICQSAISWHLENPAERAPVAVVTENYKHFSLLADYLNKRLKRNEPKLLIVKAKDYFSV